MTITKTKCAVGIDLGGTKIVTALVNADGQVIAMRREPTHAQRGAEAIIDQIIVSAQALLQEFKIEPVGLGVGVAGQIEPETGVVRFAPNLDWHNVPFQSDLQRALHMPVVVTNDVRAATIGEWLYGAGRGYRDLICVFVGTGIGGGIVAGGRMLLGCTNTAGEVGHMTIDLHGPACSCGKRGCLEALAGGWAIAEQAQNAVRAQPESGAAMLRLAQGERDKINARIVAQAFHDGDELARRVVEEVAEALTAGLTTLINALNPCRILLGGGVIEGIPELIGLVDRGVRQQALSAALSHLEISAAQLGNHAGMIGAAALAMQALAP